MQNTKNEIQNTKYKIMARWIYIYRKKEGRVKTHLCPIDHLVVPFDS